MTRAATIALLAMGGPFCGGGLSPRVMPLSPSRLSILQGGGCRGEMGSWELGWSGSPGGHVVYHRLFPQS